NQINELVVGKTTGTEALILENSSHTIVAFRGTETKAILSLLPDLLTDISFWMRRSDIGGVHSGFSKALEEVESPVVKILEKSSKPILVTGHSLGGALAKTLVIRNPSLKYESCYTYGAPAVGDSKFSQNVKIPVVRIINGADVVPRLLALTPDLVGGLLSFFKFVLSKIPEGNKFRASFDSLIDFLNKCYLNSVTYAHFGDAYLLTRSEGLRPYPTDETLLGYMLSLILEDGKNCVLDHFADSYVDRLGSFPAVGIQGLMAVAPEPLPTLTLSAATEMIKARAPYKD
ncbi:MAG: lipase family protein, partial [Proteobacteria bacterium]